MDWLLLVLGAGTIYLIASDLPSVIQITSRKLQPINHSTDAEIDGTSQLGS
jgi:hypothetical protein